jgi:hypothetical protein
MRRNPAGGSSMRKFREERRATLRAEWRGLAVIVCATLASAIWLALGDGWGRLLAAFLLGSGLTTLLWGWKLGFDAHSLRWAWGAWGEQWTAEELAKLERGWSVYHDIPDGRGNWDHVLVGSPGVFVIDSKHLSEPAVVDSKGLRAGRLRAGGSATRQSAVQDEKDHRERDRTRSVGARSRRRLGPASGRRRRARQGPLRPARKLVETLRDRPARLTAAQCT